MRWKSCFIPCLLLTLPLVDLFALGQAYRETVEDDSRSVVWQEMFSPSASLVRIYRAEAWVSVVVDGEVHVELSTAGAPRLEVRGSRALLDQFNVFSFDRTLFLWINRNLLGPREAGRLTIRLDVPELQRLEVIEGTRVSGTIASSRGQRWVARAGSRMDLRVDVPELDLEATWNSLVRLEGRAGAVRLLLKDNAEAALEDVRLERLDLDARGRSRTWVGRVPLIEGSLGEHALLMVPDDLDGESWARLRPAGRIQIGPRP